MNAYLSDKLKVVSALSMLLVIFIHSFNLSVRLKTGYVVLDRGYNFFIQEFISHGMARTAVPLFFAISAYLFFLNLEGRWSDFVDKYRKRARSLLLPYLFWSLWSVFFIFLMQQLPPPKIFFTNNLVHDFNTHKWLSTVFIHPVAYQLWFLRDLILLVLLSPLVFWLLKHLGFWLLLPFACLWFWNAELYLLSNEAVFFFLIGAYLSRYRSEWLFKLWKTVPTLWFSIAWFIVLMAKIMLTYFNQVDTPAWNLSHKLSIIIGILALWGIYDVLLSNRNRFILRLSVYSFFLYAFHEPVLMAIKSIFFYTLQKTPANWLFIYFFAPLITIGLGIFVAAQLRKRSPVFYGWITGGR